jgi:MFS family permease
LLSFGGLALAMAAVAGTGAAAGVPVIPLAVVLAFVAGAASAITTVSAQTALFENMPAQARGRIFGVLASIVSAASLVPILIAGPLADAITGPAVIAIAAAGVLVLAGWSALAFGEARSQVTDQPPTTPAR